MSDFSLAQLLDSGSADDRRLSRNAFSARMLDDERVDLDLASLDNPAAPMPERRQAALLRARLEDWRSASYIGLDDPRTIAGLQTLEFLGILGEGRAEAILTAPVQPGERP